MRIAVIGSGISGLGAAHFLSKKHKVDLFEKNDHFGGHSYTAEVSSDELNKKIYIDLGFIVFNKINYPNLVKLFDNLKVDYEKSDMSFSVSVKNSGIEYSGSGLQGLFANKYNILNLDFIKMIKEIFYFYKIADKIEKENFIDQTLGEFLKTKKMSSYFIKFHIIPMVAAIWSMPFAKARDMPLKFFLNFFINHGLFKLKNRPQWYTVTDRSRTYVKKVLEKISGEVFKNYKVNKINRSEDNVRITIGDEYLDYDQVILASHADQSLQMLENATEDEQRILSKFKYVSNTAILHTDAKLMPKRKSAWSSWNSISKGNQTCVTYWLNNLQNLNCDDNFFLTLNPIYEINKMNTIKKINFTHPYFNSETSRLQKSLNSLQGKKRTWYCGSYFGYGFHEDGLKSAINLIENFKI